MLMFEDKKIHDNESGRQSAGAGELDNFFHGLSLWSAHAHSQLL
jgi:hypothetical protein